MPLASPGRNPQVDPEVPVLSQLRSWNDGRAKRAIVDFVERTCGGRGSTAVPVESRLAVFDNDGTLWCEKPLPIQLYFSVGRLVAMAEARPELRGRQPWKAALEHDDDWFDAVLVAHYAGDDTNVPTLAAGVLATDAGISVDDYESQAAEFLRGSLHPILGRPLLDCTYRPMVELLAYLEDNGFSNYLASGGGRDFMRPISQQVYGIPRERVIGSSTKFVYTSDEHGGTIAPGPSPTTSQTVPRSRSASGTAPAGDRWSRAATPTATSPCCSTPITPITRPFASSSSTTTPSVSSPTRPVPRRRSNEPGPRGWTVVSMKNDWSTVF